jgi:circadian clock protein KaiB
MSKKTDAEGTPIQDATAAFELVLTESGQRQYALRLYVAGMTVNSLRAIENVQKLCDEHMHGRFELEIIDIYQQPIFAKEGQIVAAPTLVEELPAPLAQIHR